MTVKCSEVGRSCQFRSEDNACYSCDYILITGKMRKCLPEKCNKYIKGRRKKRIK